MATERKIGSHVYRCDKMPAAEGLAMLLRVTKFFRAAPAMLESVVKNTEEGKSAFLVLCLSGDIDPAETQKLLTDLVESCTTGSDPCVVGVKPATMDEMIPVAWFALEVNFKDFLAGSLA